MKKLLLVYNPFSGDKSFKYDLDAYIYGWQSGGYQVHPFRAIQEGDIDQYFAQIGRRRYDAVAAAGGDGTINIVANAMMRHGVKAPLSIIPAGTANDLATFLKLPREPEKAVELVLRGKTLGMDLGLVNNSRYFINVCAAGLFTNISQQIDTDFKDVLGKMGYYVKGLGQLPSFEPITVRISNSRETIEETIYLYMVLNSAGTGGFENLSPGAAVHDGLFDFIAVKSRNIMDLALLFVKILSGDYLQDSNVIFFRDSYIKVEMLPTHDTGAGRFSHSEKLLAHATGETADQESRSDFSETTLDGEPGPQMPVEIQMIPGALEVFVP